MVAPVEDGELFDFADEEVPVSEDVFAVNDAEDSHGAGETLEEQDAIDILMAWKQTRNQINKEKISRGFNGGAADLKKMEARVRCFKRKKVGHFSRNCPSRKGQGKGPSSAASSSTRASYVNTVMDAQVDVEEKW